MRVGWNSWSFEVSDEWTVKEDPECLSLYCSDNGALQASSARKQDGAVTLQDLLFGEDQRDKWGSYKLVQCGQFDGIVYEYTQEAIAWRRWFLRNGSVLLCVTYNGTVNAAERDAPAVSRVLDTARTEVSSDA